MDKLDQATQEIQDVLRKYNVSLGWEIHARNAQDISDEVKLSLNILKKSNISILFKLEEIK